MEKDKNKSSNSEPYSLKNLGLVDVKAAFSSLLQQIKEKTTPKSRTAVDTMPNQKGNMRINNRFRSIDA